MKTTVYSFDTQHLTARVYISQRIDNRTLIKMSPPCVHEKYHCRDPLGLFEKPVHFPPPLRHEENQASKIVNQESVRKEDRSKTHTKPVIPSQKAELSQDPSMESIQELKSEKKPTVVQKRLSLAANKLEYLARRQKAGGDIWFLKQGRNAVIPEINFNKFWNEQKGVFVTAKKTNLPTESLYRKKMSREEEEWVSRKRQCIDLHIQNQVQVPSIRLVPINEHMKKAPYEARVSGYTTDSTYQKKIPREEDESLSRKKQCTAPAWYNVPHRFITQGHAPSTSFQNASVLEDVRHQRQYSLHPHQNQNQASPAFPVQRNVTTRMIPVASSGQAQRLPKYAPVHPQLPSGQASDLTRFGLEYQLSIRPFD